ncbi:TrkA-N domain-containingdehydrogenase [Purpureocillium lilacinum]|nr:TrkA-N domain-containingdehydrogenase [Purpureocillium lilacinum]OAQ80321.1 TrkA-N domain-containingdehydrogenase [Purpureocillium lilacinum]OAQ88274.1 TrkA-N domain-containingdehydrogenase [Purpureocillium lilacinum]GJN75189.1 hypothetical protein PLICBS_009285 [Purpureocillium lilacinum]GJN85077.1 hypothetical protein PLIIFM63780_008641 [Purpureocillium lilacinum]
MHIYIAGATGRNGSLVLADALERGHTVTALARSPSSSSLPLSHPRLTVVAGTPTSQSDVERALATPRRPDAVITALNPRRTSDSPFSPLRPGGDSPPDLLPETARILLAAIARVFPSSSARAATASPPPKLVVNSSFGVGSSWRAMTWPMKLIFSHGAMSVTLRGHNDMDALVRGSGLPFVLARPARLIEGAPSSVTALPDDGAGCGWNPVITRHSAARWLVQAAESDTWDGTSPVIVN